MFDMPHEDIFLDKFKEACGISEIKSTNLAAGYGVTVLPLNLPQGKKERGALWLLDKKGEMVVLQLSKETALKIGQLLGLELE